MDGIPLLSLRVGSWKMRARNRVIRMKRRLMEVFKRLRHSGFESKKRTIVVELKEEPAKVEERFGELGGQDAMESIPVRGINSMREDIITREHNLLEEIIEEREEAEHQELMEDLSEENEVDHTENGSDFGLANVPFVMLLERAPSELPEDVERIIFEMAARAFPSEILKTLVYVNHRVKTWVEYVLYETVILRDAKQARIFFIGLEKKNPEFIERAVKVLALPTRVSFETSSRILEACKNVRHLSWLPTNRLTEDIVALIVALPLSSLRARLVSFLGDNPDFSHPVFKQLTTLCIADHQDVWKKWTWSGMKTRPNLKWIAVNLDGRLDTFSGWAPVRTIEKMLLRPYGGPSGVRLCVCYHHNPAVDGCRWMHRTEQTFSEERMVVLSLDHRIDGERWLERATGECRDFEISEVLVTERQQEERRLHFALNRSSLLVQ